MTTLLKQVMAHWCQWHHSALDLPANSVASQPCKSSQWRVESKRNKRVGYCKFRSRWGDFDISPLKSDPCALQSVVPCLWIKFAYFSEKRKLLLWNQIQTNFYRSGIDQFRYQKSHILPNWSVIFFQLVNRGHDPWLEFGMTQSA